MEGKQKKNPFSSHVINSDFFTEPNILLLPYFFEAAVLNDSHAVGGPCMV